MGPKALLFGLLDPLGGLTLNPKPLNMPVTKSSQGLEVEDQGFSLRLHVPIWEFPKIRGYLIWGAYNEDPII